MCVPVMIVCVCKNINTAQITESVRGGARSVEDIRNDTGATSCCGKCQFRVNRLLNEQSGDQGSDCFYDAAAG